MTAETIPALPDNPWREFIDNCISGDNYFRASEYRQLLADLDAGYAAIEALAEARAYAAALAVDAARYRFLRDSQNCSLSINHNDHHNMYETLEQVFEHHGGDPKSDYYGDIPSDERAAMIATDSLWTLHIYPNTPVGFNVYHGATLDAAIDAALQADTARAEGEA